MTTPALAVDLSTEREAHLQRQKRTLTEARAGRLLDRAGWKATSAELKTEYREWWGKGLMKETLEEAQRLQRESRTTVRHIPVEDYMAKKTDSAKLRAFIRELLVGDPELSTGEAYNQMKQQFGYDLKRSSFEVTYFYPVRKEMKAEPKPPPVPSVPAKTEEELDEEIREALDQEPEIPEPAHQRMIIFDAGPDEFFNATEKENEDWVIELKVVVDGPVMDEIRNLAWREMFG